MDMQKKPMDKIAMVLEQQIAVSPSDRFKDHLI